MATAIMSTMSSLPLSPQNRPILRRATYVHISDLTSAYNIDHARLEQELARVKADREAAASRTPIEAEHDDDPGGVSTDLDSTSVPQKRLQPPRGGYNLCVLVGKVNVVVDKRRVDQSRVRLAEVEIGDETGTVSLRARDEQIDTLEDVSNRSGAVVLRNCTLELYQGKHIRLAVTKWGKLSTYPDNVASTPPPPSKMNFDRNFSLIDLSVVASEMVDPQSDPTFTTRPVKIPESLETGGGRAIPLKPGGATHRQHQQFQQPQPSTRRGSRGGDRRQSRGKGTGGGSGAPVQTHYGTPEDSALQQPSGQMRYQGMHGYTGGYDQPTMDVRHYSFPHGRQQEVMSQASAQQMMLQQQYEMQQRQLQQMYHDQQERHRSGLGQGRQMQASPMLMPTVVGSSSFETTGEYSLPSYATSGSSPLMVPMSMPGGRVPTGAQELRKESGSQHPEGSYAAALDRGMRHEDSRSPGGEEFSPGKMNPQATVFAPSYMNPQVNPQTTHQLYFPFDPSQGTGGALYHRPAPQHHAVYGPGMMYVPAGSGSSKPMGSQEPSDANPSRGTGPSDAAIDSQASGKENLHTFS